MTEKVVEIASKRIVALSSFISLSRNVSWVAPGTKGFEPSNVYAIADGDDVLLVDTGLPCHRGSVINWLHQLCDRDIHLSIFLTRPAELDCVGNLRAILDSVTVDRIVSTFPTDPLDFIPVGDPQFEEPQVVRLHPGDRIYLGGVPSLEVVDPPLRTLVTAWLYDLKTGTLFTSDTFCHVKCDYESASPVTTEGNTSEGSEDFDSQVANVRGQLLAKFDWLQLAEVSTIQQAFEQVFARLQVQTIAPAHGCVLLDAAVSTHYRLVLNALRNKRSQ